MLLGFVTVLLLYSVRATQVSGMSMGFALAIKEDYWAFHAHHLLYQPIMLVLHRLLGPSGCDAICAGQTWSILWGTVIALGTYAIALKALASRTAALIATSLVVVSHGFLIYSTQLEPYIPILGMLTLLSAVLVLNEGPPVRWRWNALFVIVFALSLFHHQATVFFLVPAGYYAMATAGRAGLRWAVLITVATGIPVLLVFIATFWATNPSPDVSGFLQWLLYYAIVSDSTHGALLMARAAEGFSDERIREAVRSLTQLFVVLPPSSETWSASGNEFGNLQKPLRYLIAAALPVIFLWNTIQVARGGDEARLRTFLLIWWVTLGIFAFWWKASVYKFYIPVITPTILLGAFMVNDLVRGLGSRTLQGIVAALVTVTVVLMLLSNLQATVLPLHRSKGQVFEQARRFDEATPQECVLYTKRYLGPQLGYYFDRTGRPFSFMFKKLVYSEIDPFVAANIHTQTDFGDDPCGVIPLHWVSREFFANDIIRGLDGHVAPDDWDKFITWFLEVRPEAESPRVSFSEVEIFTGQAGDRYLLVRRTSRQYADSLDSLLERLDQIQRAGGDGIFSRGESPGVGRLRRLAFGYH